MHSVWCLYIVLCQSSSLRHLFVILGVFSSNELIIVLSIVVVDARRFCGRTCKFPVFYSFLARVSRGVERGNSSGQFL
jgi:hypothetical protein